MPTSSAQRIGEHHDMPSQSEDRQPVRLGRKRDHTRDDDILDATLDVLAEVGYTGLTMDMVAARATAGKATIYRRWSSKNSSSLRRSSI